MTRPPDLRAAVPDDAAAITAVCTRSARGAYAGLVTPDYLERALGHFYGLQRLRREIATQPGWFGFTVAQVDAHVAGVSGTGISAHEPSACELFALYVDPDHQRRGLGTRLVTHSIEQARQAGASRLDVAVIPGNTPAIAFYQACGFTDAGERPIYAPHGEAGGPQVALVFSRLL